MIEVGRMQFKRDNYESLVEFVGLGDKRIEYSVARHPDAKAKAVITQGTIKVTLDEGDWAIKYDNGDIHKLIKTNVEKESHAENSILTLDLIQADNGDWEMLYINRKLEAENHSLDIFYHLKYWHEKNAGLKILGKLSTYRVDSIELEDIGVVNDLDMAKQLYTTLEEYSV